MSPASCCCTCDDPRHRREQHGETCTRCGKHRAPKGRVVWLARPSLSWSEEPQGITARDDGGHVHVEAFTGKRRLVGGWWCFWARLERAGPQLVLDNYAELERPTTRHKLRNVRGRAWYSRLRLDRGRAGFLPDDQLELPQDVPMPELILQAAKDVLPPWQLYLWPGSTA